jgi:hypothetical protein
MPPQLQLQPIYNLRVCIDMDKELLGCHGVDWSVLGRFSDLETLQLAITYDVSEDETPQGTFPNDGTSNRWKASMILNGLIKQIVESVPGKVALKWGAWDHLKTDLKEWRSECAVCIDAALLEEIASDFEHLRGRAVRDEKRTGE